LQLPLLQSTEDNVGVARDVRNANAKEVVMGFVLPIVVTPVYVMGSAVMKANATALATIAINDCYDYVSITIQLSPLLSNENSPVIFMLDPDMR